MSFRSRAPLCALLATCALPLSAHAEHAADAVVESVIVTARPDPEDPPVVAAARARLSETPGAVAVISSESYEDRFALGFADTLRSAPGVFAQKRWGEETRLSIRGSGVGQSFHMRGVLLAQDGVPFNQADGFADFQELDPLIVRYTEVYKGGNALRFGGASLGGAINLITPTGETAAYKNVLRVEGGSFGTARLHGEIARDFGDWDLFAAATGTRADGWRDQGEQSAGRLSVNIGRTFGADREIRAILSANDIQQNISSAVTLAGALDNPKAVPANTIANDYSRDMESVRLTLQTRWRLSPSTLLEGALYGLGKDLYHPIFQVIDQENYNWGGYGRLDWSGALAGLRADAFAGLSYRAGTMDSRRFINVAGSRGALTVDEQQDAAGLDVFAEGRLFITQHAALVAGGSYGWADRDYENRLTPANSARRDFDWFAPRLGVLWEADDGAQFYANLTRTVEPPQFGALVQGGVAQFVPVESQEAWTAEAGARGRRGAFIWDVALYRAELENELLNYTIGPDIPAATFNAGDTIHQGVEAGLDWRVFDGEDGALTLRQTYAYSDFTFDGDIAYADNRLPVIPEHAYRAELKYEHPAHWFIAPSLEWVPEDVWVDYANTLKAPGYAIWSLNAGYDVGGARFFLDARNLTDERYISNFGAVTDATMAATNVFYPGEPLAAYAGVSFAWGGPP